MTMGAASGKVPVSAGPPHRRYEVWASMPTHADIVGGADTLAGALPVYLRARRTRRNCTINLLRNDRGA